MTKYVIFESREIVRIEGSWTENSTHFETTTGHMFEALQIHDSWDDARRVLIQAVMRKSKRALEAFTDAQQQLEYFVNLREPKYPPAVRAVK